MLPILYYQYHECWCPDDLMSHGISRYGISQISRNIASLASENLIHLLLDNSVNAMAPCIAMTSPAAVALAVQKEDFQIIASTQI